MHVEQAVLKRVLQRLFDKDSVMRHSATFNASLVFLLLLLPGAASAHHEPEHRVFAVGIPTEMVIVFPVCDTEEQLVEIVAAHALHGFDAARQAFTRLGRERNEKGEPMCGMATVPIVIDSVVAEAIKLDFPYGEGEITIVWLHVPGRPDIRGAAALPDVKVLPTEKAHLLGNFASI